MKLNRLKKGAPALEKNELITEPEERSKELLRALDETEKGLQTLYTDIAESDDPEQYRDELECKLRSYRRVNANLVKAYRRSVTMSDELGARWRELAKGKKKKRFWRAPANTVIDLEERKVDHFAKGINIYKILLVCYIGSFFGVLIEMLWCLLKNGYVESRAGLVFGPFNLLYGMGAVVMTLTLYRFRHNGKKFSFVGGFLVGGAVEYICSWVQETLFGSRSWDYSNMPFNINGRICLLYSVFWGILGVLWVKTLYPWMAKAILRIPNRAGKIITWVLLAFFVVNAIVSALAVFRWSQRIDLIEAPNGFWAFMDAWFPNERMEKIFANMSFQ